jgi:hypothetical protein
MVLEALLQRIKQAGLESDHSNPSYAESKNGWRFN